MNTKRKDYLVCFVPVLAALVLLVGVAFRPRKVPAVAPSIRTVPVALVRPAKSRKSTKNMPVVASVPSTFVVSGSGVNALTVTKATTFAIPAGTWTGGTWAVTVSSVTGNAVGGWVTDVQTPTDVQVVRTPGAPVSFSFAASAGQLTNINLAAGGSLSVTYGDTLGQSGPITFSETISSFTLTLVGTGGPIVVTDSDTFTLTDTDTGGISGITKTHLPGDPDAGTLTESASVNILRVTYFARNSFDSAFVSQYYTVSYPGGYVPGADLDMLGQSLPHVHFTKVVSRNGSLANVAGSLLQVFDNAGAELAAGVATATLDIWRIGT